MESSPNKLFLHFKILILLLFKESHNSLKLWKFIELEPISNISKYLLENNPSAKLWIPATPILVFFKESDFNLVEFLKASTIKLIPFKPTLFPFQTTSFKHLERVIKFFKSKQTSGEISLLDKSKLVKEEPFSIIDLAPLFLILLSLTTNFLIVLFWIRAAPILSPLSSPKSLSCKIKVSILELFNKILARIIPPSPEKLFLLKEPSRTPKFKYFKCLEAITSFWIIFKPSVLIILLAKFKYSTPFAEIKLLILCIQTSLTILSGNSTFFIGPGAKLLTKPNKKFFPTLIDLKLKFFKSLLFLANNSSLKYFALSGLEVSLQSLHHAKYNSAYILRVNNENI